MLAPPNESFLVRRKPVDLSESPRRSAPQRIDNAERPIATSKTVGPAHQSHRAHQLARIPNFAAADAGELGVIISADSALIACVSTRRSAQLLATALCCPPGGLASLSGSRLTKLAVV